ncbi:MAG: sigma-70 family RNA polymerase sigma factor [Myxococcota bacterium]
MTPQSDDVELLRAWQSGDTRCGDVLVRRHYPNVRRFFDVKVPRVAEDLTQRTFLACQETLHAYRADATFKSYLFGIARLQLLRYLRKSHRAEAFGKRVKFGGPSVRTSLSMIVANRQEHHLILLAYAKLSPDQQIAVELFYWEDMAAAEIAHVLETPVSTVTTRLSRARAVLREAVVSLTQPGAIRERVVGDLEGWTRALVPRPNKGPTA